MSLSIKTKELLCDQFEYSNCRDAASLQRHLSSELAHVFEVGGEKDAATDLWKANHYREKAGLPPLNAGSPVFRTENFYSMAGWYTFGRLNTLKVNQLSEAVGHAFLHRLFSIAGLSYLLEIPFHIGVIVYSTFFKPVTEAEAKLSYKERTHLRFVNVLTKDERLPRLLNAALWGPLNLAAFLIAGPVAIALNITGFALDFCLAVAFTVQKLYQMRNAINELDEEIANKKVELANLESAKARGNVVDEKRINTLRHDINGLQNMQLDVEDRYAESKEQAVYGLLFTGVILAGIIMSFFPPTMILGAVLTTITMIFSIPDTIQNTISFVKTAKDFVVNGCNKIMQFFKPKPIVQLDEKLDVAQQPELTQPLLTEQKAASTSNEGSYKEFYSTLGTPQNNPVTVGPITIEQVAISETMAANVEMQSAKNEEIIKPKTKNDTAFVLTNDSSFFTQQQAVETNESLDQKEKESWTPTSYSLTSQTVY